jgi:hypothetical protein
VVLGIGAALGIWAAEMWRRRMLHDSYANYLPPPRESETPEASGGRPAGRVRGAVHRVWTPVAASARRDVIHVRRMRAGAPAPGPEPAPSPVEPVVSPRPRPDSP